MEDLVQQETLFNEVNSMKTKACKVIFSLVFLILLCILTAYRQSNELRRQILCEIEQFNTRLNTLEQTSLISKQSYNLKLATLMYGSNISLKEGSTDSEIYSRRFSGQGGN